MPRLRQLSGDDIIQILGKFGFTIHSQKGSHVKVRRIAAGNKVQTLTVPRHKDLDSGTIRAIFRQASRFIPEENLHSHFYSD